jgi:putative transposase
MDVPARGAGRRRGARGVPGGQAPLPAVVATSQREPVAELASVRALRDALRHVKHLQRAVSRAEKGSANRRKAVAWLGRTHTRVAAVRADALHTFTAQLARDYGVVVVEDLKTAT